MEIPIPDRKIRAAYKIYRDSSPLNKSNSDFKQDRWISSQQVEFLDFTLLIQKVFHSKYLNNLVDISAGDFDNLAPALESMIQSQLVSIGMDGELIYHGKKKELAINQNQGITWDEPTNQLNQFPCSRESIVKRYNFLQERYALYEKVSIGLFGDDDLLSLLLDSNNTFSTSVYEYDERITKYILNNTKHTKVKQCNLTEEQGVCDITHDTFLIDPPYTFHGALCFILAGLKTLRKDTQSEFYVILNRMICGKMLPELLKHLAIAEIHVESIHENFNQYDLPKGYTETANASNFLAQHNTDTKSLIRSSSSNLYIFRTKEPNIKYLSKLLKTEFIYNHYQW